MGKTIERILADAAQKNQFFAKTEASMKWFYERARRTNVTSASFMREYTRDAMRTTTQLAPGHLYCFNYDPKHKETLPYYDNFPMIFLTEIRSDGFSGINLHYLPYRQRAFLMDALYDLENNASIPANKKLNISYGILRQSAGHKAFAPCYKRYLRKHVRSRLLKIQYEEWHVAVFLPLQSFAKADQKKVWADSLQKMNK